MMMKRSLLSTLHTFGQDGVSGVAFDYSSISRVLDVRKKINFDEASIPSESPTSQFFLLVAC